MRTWRLNAAAVVGLCGVIGACNDTNLWDQTGTAGGPQISSTGGVGGSTAGSAGSGGQQGGDSGAAGTAGAGGNSGSGGTGSTAGGGGTGGTDVVYECPADDGTAAALTLAGLGLELPPSVGDAGASDAGTGDAGIGDEFEGLQLPGLSGWASHPGLGTATTIGGAAGEVVTATTAAELIDFASRAEPLVIRICGVIVAPEVRVSAHKTLLGVGAFAGVEGGIRIGADGENVRNVVLKNLHVNARSSAVAASGVHIDNAHHVWVDRCDLFDAFDTGAGLQVVRGGDFVTVSSTKFHFTDNTPDPEHRFACRIGDHDNLTDSEAMDPGHLKVTLHHNWFADNVRQRAPRVRIGDVHVFNNYYSVGALLNDYSVWASTGARILLENNYFDGVVNPHELQGVDAQILAIGNRYNGATGQMESTGTAFTPPYAYTPDPALGLPALVTGEVGPR
jgi:pectate lyase